ncbi:Lyzozyme M1 (1,4-beta-N-acetylmuramidase), GH25 family [Clostridium cavendishii DSM 21758]|uniref:Lyzozyme M1 (1,4-beta-N-acetylmuramidase), GH25 family n=1 Tax=Clostridium cavendishii DSM 21758 TaxID=1121302 RepID=A0A1M6MPI2_9CLOT|nr:glycoside hydrolase family 25 protein [Clostridium cavendishii]SHJ85415.1 Lyzozyme M1 (1,4-beta-N-acetylmuramidase), GH25 family [Clostridium cavendishii DSM 21758]
MQDKNPFSTFGPDLNEYKSNVDFKVLASNSDFVYLRSSGSATGKFRVDKKFIEYAKGCRDYGIPCGAYHFAVPSADLTTADAQCDSFIQVLQQGFGDKDYGDLFPVVDVETPANKSITTTQLVNWIDRFRKRFESKTRRKLMLYTGLFFINLYDNFNVPGKGYPLKNMPLWIAMYVDVPSNPKVPPSVGGWTKWTLWQYTEKGNIKGVDPPVDLNWGPNSVDYLTPPRNVQGLAATMDNAKIYVTWKRNTDKDLYGYNVFVNSEYAGTVGKLGNSLVINKSKFSLPKGQPIVISIEAFDAVGDVSKTRSKVVITDIRMRDASEPGIYIGNDFIYIK